MSSASSSPEGSSTCGGWPLNVEAEDAPSLLLEGGGKSNHMSFSSSSVGEFLGGTAGGEERPRGVLLTSSGVPSKWSAAPFSVEPCGNIFCSFDGAAEPSLIGCTGHTGGGCTSGRIGGIPGERFSVAAGRVFVMVVVVVEQVKTECGRGAAADGARDGGGGTAAVEHHNGMTSWLAGDLVVVGTEVEVGHGSNKAAGRR